MCVVCGTMLRLPKKKFLCSRRQNHTQRIKWAYIRNTALFFVLFSEPKYFWPLFALVLFYKFWNEIAAFLQLPFAKSFWRVREISLFYDTQSLGPRLEQDTLNEADHLTTEIHCKCFSCTSSFERLPRSFKSGNEEIGCQWQLQLQC